MKEVQLTCEHDDLSIPPDSFSHGDLKKKFFKRCVTVCVCGGGGGGVYARGAGERGGEGGRCTGHR